MGHMNKWMLVLGFITAWASPSFAQSERDAWQRVPAVVDALRISKGSTVADLGAGSQGYFTQRLSPVVGATGRVYAVDISDRAIRGLNALTREQGLSNVKVIRGQDDDPRLPAASLDAVLIVNAYHDMEQPESVLRGVLRALRPGGRLVILDYAPSDVSARASRAEQTSEHELDLEIAATELQGSGFEILERDPRFTSEPYRDRAHPQWMLIARRPAEDPEVNR